MPRSTAILALSFAIVAVSMVTIGWGASAAVPAPMRAAAGDAAGTGFPIGLGDSAGAAAGADSADADSADVGGTGAWDEILGPGGPGRAPAESLAALRAGAAGVDYLWVLRTALVDSAAVDSTVERARRMGVRGLLVQVVGRADAWYRSDLLPRAEPLARTPDFDPLARVLRRARAAGLEVHAWMNCMLVWSAPRPPVDPRHVIRKHPEWVTCLGDGRPLTRVGPRERRRRGIEGVYLSPAHPGVRRWIAAVAGEIARRYEVDGIHLDYIRLPDAGAGFDATTRARFALAAGVDPLRTARLPQPRRAAVEASWRAFLREQITDIVAAVRDSVRGARPGVTISAAVAADTLRAERDVAQPWRAWLRAGLVDRVYPMCYAPGVQEVMDQLVGYAADGLGGRVVPGIAVYNAPPSAAALKILGARALGFPRLALYSYDSLFAGSGHWQELERRLSPQAATNRGGP